MQLGFLPFLRRNHKAYPPIPGASPIEDGAPSTLSTELLEAVSAMTVTVEPESEAVQGGEIALDPGVPQSYQSERYGYTLTIPAGWRSGTPTSAPGAPAVDRFSGPGSLKVGIWNETCPLRSLPSVAPADRVGVCRLGSRRAVPFVAFAPSVGGGTQFLEARWLAQGRRWTVDLQIGTEATVAEGLALAQLLLATFAMAG